MQLVSWSNGAAGPAVDSSPTVHAPAAVTRAKDAGKVGWNKQHRVVLEYSNDSIVCFACSQQVTSLILLTPSDVSKMSNFLPSLQIKKKAQTYEV